jgi:hypothetical protein
MSCPDFTGPGCSGGQTADIAAAAVVGLVVAAETVQWVTDRIWWIGSTMAVCFVLAIAASPRGWKRVLAAVRPPGERHGASTRVAT